MCVGDRLKSTGVNAGSQTGTYASRPEEMDWSGRGGGERWSYEHIFC